MKKAIASFFVLFLTISLLSSCFNSTPWSEGKLKDSFFTKEYLANYKAEDLPVPNITGSYLDEEEEILYLNLTREEYESYVKKIIGYLKEDKTITLSGYYCETGIFGLLIFPLPEYRFAPFYSENFDYSLDSYLFMFTKEYIFDDDWSNEMDLSEEKYISIKWNPTEHGSGETHTVEMKLNVSVISKYLPCYHGHNYESISYPVAGSEKEIVISTCEYCGKKIQNEYIGENDITRYTVSVTEGDEYLIRCPDSGYAGLLYDIVTPALVNDELTITVNGTEIPKIKTEAGKWIYRFIMPSNNVEVEIKISGDE